MKGIYLIFIFSIISQTLLFSQVVVKRNNQVSKELANVNWSKEYTLFDYTTDEPIFPLIRNGQPVYKIYYASKEDPRPTYGEFSIAQVEGLKYYKFKNRETCFKFCLANKWNAVPTLTTTGISSITNTSAISGGNITSDGGTSITARGLVWSTSTNPTITLTTKTSNGTGIGSFSSTLTNLTPNTIYYVRAYANNSAGTGYGNEISFTTTDSSSVMGIPCPGTPTVKDIDGNTYNTVQIGTQCWTKENLRVTKYRDGMVIPLDESGGTTGYGTGQTWSFRTTGARTLIGPNSIYLTTYGYLYNWYAVTNTKGLCPNGWYIPSDAEWTTLITYLGGESIAGGKMKSIGTVYWNSPNSDATNESGFSALPGGYRDNGGSFSSTSYDAFFWSATEYEADNAWYRRINYNYGNVKRYSSSEQNGFSIRCIKDTIFIVSIPTLTTTTITAITTTSATSGGVITSDGGASISARGVVWSTSTNPTIALSTKTSDGTGTGSFTSLLTNLTPKTTYYVRAYATNSTGTGYGNEITLTTTDSSSVMGIPCPGTPTVKDIDGNTYNTVQIGTQCWTKENLRVTKYRDGSVVPLDESGGVEGTGSGQTWSSRTTGAKTVYGHNDANLATYGYLYNWYAAIDAKGLCPSGWHVPTVGELLTLTTYLGGESVAGGKLKSIGTSYWTSPNTGATNESGFNALPGAVRSYDGSYFSIRDNAFFWSNTDYGKVGSAYILNLFSNNSKVFLGASRGLSMGASVRCLKDTNSMVSIPTLTTTSISAITTTTATSGGNITSDGRASITARGVVWSTSTNPTINLTTKTSNGTGTGSFSSSLTNLTPKTTYYVRAYATNSAGTGYGNELTFTTTDSTSVMGIPCPGTPTVKDIDGNTYNTVQIGTQCWTKENLRVTKYRDGTVIPFDESGGTNGGGTGQTWSSRTTGAITVYGHSASNLTTYGYLYNWYAAVDSKGLCSSGWHVPSDTEWTVLTNFLGGSSVAGGKMKTIGTANWNSPNTGATNESGFSVLPGGFRMGIGSFNSISYAAVFWSSTEYDNSNAWGRLPDYYEGKLDNMNDSKSIGASVRCLKDSNSIVSIPSLTTTAISAITTTTATSGGNITSDGGASITARGIVWSTTANPTINLTTKTTTGAGTGSFTSTLTNLTPKTTYYVRAYATNSAGTGYGNEITFTTAEAVMNIPCPGTPTVKDIDGNIYNTVQIGTQCWTKENLRVSKYRDGTVIPLDESGGTTGNVTGETWSSRATGARTVYGQSAANLATYGYLYNWYAVTDSKGLCPSGWYVPSNSEWTVLNNFLGGSSVAGGKMKATGTANWNSPNIGASNESGLTVLPGGRRYSSDGFVENTDYAFFWSSTEFNNISSFYLYIASSGARLYRNGTNFGGITENKDGFSVRCIKDNNKTDSLATLVTATITGINSSSATSGGYINSDRGAVISARGVVWSTTPSPTIAVSTKTSNGSGTGYFTSTLTNLTPKTIYYVRAYGTNNSITEYGNEISFITSDSTNVLGIPCQGTPSVKDIDGNTYNTVQIGTQCWTKENLKVTRYRDGMLIPLDESGGSEGNGSDQTWSSRTTGTRTVNKSTASNVEIFTTYGYLYNWYAVADRKGLCPSGWHVPSDSEWKKLIDFLGGERVAGGKLKSTGTTLWNNPNTRATNESGFLALPGGCRYSNGLYFSLGYDAFFWSATDFDFTIAWYQDLHLGDSSIISDTNNKTFGASVRCLKDTFSIVSIPTLTTTSITAVSTSSATSGGNITSDGGASITARGVVWSTSTNPTIALTIKTTDGSGTDSFTSSLTNLAPKTTYYVRAYATNSAGTGYGNEISFTTAEAIMNIPCPGTPTVKDIDGNVYNTVQIGTQCWTKENLRVTKYRDGTVIPLDESNSIGGEYDIWQDITIGARSIYNNNIDNLRDYGYLYNGYSVLDSKGICPDGWHIPAYSEWSELTNYLGGQPVAGDKMKSTGWSFWSNSGKNSTNESGFSALPGGYRVYNGAFYELKFSAFFWSISLIPYSEDNLRTSSLSFNDDSFYAGNNGFWKFMAASIRCLKDTSSIKNSPTVSTESATNQNSTSTSSGGLVISDGGSSILNRGVVWSTQPSPTISLNTKTVNGNGKGSFISILDNLLPNKKYYYRAYATNSIGTSYGNELSFMTPDSINWTGKACYRDSIVKDIDGNIYNNVQIGNQCWLRENLRVTRYNDGSAIPLDESGGSLGNDFNQSWGNRIEGSRTIYSNNRENFETYGYLYNWYAMVDERGICPKGWHIPSDGEWNILIKQLDSKADLIYNVPQSEVAGGKMKSTGTTLWSSPNKGSTDESGFHALPGGFRSSKGSFYGIGSTAYYWSTTKVQGGIGAWHRKLTFFEGNIKRSADVSYDQSKSIGFSARCLMD